MNNTFIGKNNKLYAISDLLVGNLLKNQELLNMYSMKELHELYSYYFGNYEYEYKNILKAKIKEYNSCNSFIEYIFNSS